MISVERGFHNSKISIISFFFVTCSRRYLCIYLFTFLFIKVLQNWIEISTPYSLARLSFPSTYSSLPQRQRISSDLLSSKATTHWNWTFPLNLRDRKATRPWYPGFVLCHQNTYNNKLKKFDPLKNNEDLINFSTWMS